MSAKKMSDHDFLELYNEGLMDIEIAEIMGVSHTLAYSRRKSMGLPKNPRHCRTSKRWKVYDGDTFLVEGTTREIMQEFLVSKPTVYRWAQNTEHGMPCRYKVIEMVDA